MDASAFIYRAHKALPKLMTKSGERTGATFGFTSALLKLIKDKKPKFLAVVFDSRGPTRRHQIYPQYKAHRPPMEPELAAQQAPIRQIVSALALKSLEQPGFEADDLIAALCFLAKEQSREVIIVSGDKDFYQLLSPLVSMYDPDPKKKSALNLESFKTRFNLEPEGFLEAQGLMGDSTDNIPGIPGVGEITAVKLISEFGSIDNLYHNLDKVKSEALRLKLKEHEDSARLSKELAKLGQGLAPPSSIEDLAMGSPNFSLLMSCLNDFEFFSLIKTVKSIYGDNPQLNQPQSPSLFSLIDNPGPAPSSAPTSLFTLTTNSNSQKASTIVNYSKYLLVDNPSAWTILIQALDRVTTDKSLLALDLETDSLSPSRAKIVGLSLATGENEAFYVPIAHKSLKANNQQWSEVEKILGPYLTAQNPPKIGQNAKFDWHILLRYGLILPPPAADPMLASYLLNPDDRHGLDSLSLKFLGHKPIPFTEVVPDPKKSDFSSVEPNEACLYAAEDADLTLRLASILQKSLKQNSPLDALYYDLELPLEELLTRMEFTGVLIDKEILAALSIDLAKTMAAKSEIIYDLAGEKFNLASTQQTADVLFNKLKIPSGKMTAKKQGYSTDSEVMSDLAVNYPICAAILEWREVQKLKSTYADKLPLTVNPNSGRIHTSYNQALTVTGRLSSSEPNLQNIPARSEEGRRVREAFVAPKGSLLISADYSQIELRIMAHFSGDRALIEAFERNEDIHAQTAAKIFNIAPDQLVPSDIRRRAKTINFGIIYGQGPVGLAKQLNVSMSEAKTFINLYFKRFPGVLAFMKKTKLQATHDGLTSTWYGRRRYLAGLKLSGQEKKEAERMAVNTPIQGTAADIIKMAMLRVDKRLKKNNLSSKIIMQVHDELIIEALETEAEKVSQILVEEMEGVGQNPIIPGGGPLKTPLKVDVAQGQNWIHA